MESLSALAMVALGVVLLATSGTSVPRETQQVARPGGRRGELPRRVLLIPDEEEEYPYGSGLSFRSAAPVRPAKPATSEKANKEKGWLDNLFQQTSDPGSVYAPPLPPPSNQVHHVIHLSDGSTLDMGAGGLKPNKVASPGMVPIIFVRVPVSAGNKNNPYAPSYQGYAPALPDSNYHLNYQNNGQPPQQNTYAPNYPAYAATPTQNSYPPNYPPLTTQYQANYPQSPAFPSQWQTPQQNTYAPNYQAYAATPTQNSYPSNYPPPTTQYSANYAQPPASPSQWQPYPYGFYPPAPPSPPWYQAAPPKPYYWPPYTPAYRPPNRGPSGWYGSYYGYRPYGGPGAYQTQSDSISAYEGYGKPGTYTYRPSHSHPYGWNYGSQGYLPPHHHHHWPQQGGEDDDDDDDDEDDDHHHEYSHYPNDYHYPHDLKNSQKQGAIRKGLIRPQGGPATTQPTSEVEVVQVPIRNY